MNDDISRNFVWLAAFMLLGVIVASPGWGYTLIVLGVLYLMLVITNTIAREENKVLRQAKRDREQKQARNSQIQNHV